MSVHPKTEKSWFTEEFYKNGADGGRTRDLRSDSALF